ncbi:MAG: efflux RND transporter periplasmic adaptor subunit [Phenylobacterium sp.]|uniref:efflux RND transporter periplasmic adaptor subunit n=1 Tax=Phenylobacterium sp. TaxID=1871053 RepID=UPI002717F8C3|nr:efflux RND transporter periplasmic adaptor subunit [Phenylobacterium sp.]MDO8901930.1 efflux RND transporter periplasmic adaptor subunit [Phenylobacterium sp.]MDP2212376.1 efflux RND transporter periplasmic adaptor subunit [Phenylobacterium sp.]
MRLKASHIFILAVFGVLVVYFVGMSLLGGDSAPAETAAETSETPQVQVALTPEAIRPYVVTLRGRTEAARSVVVRAETSGVVAATPTREGAFVQRGAVLCRLSVDARQASLDQARAALRSRELQHKASASLAEKGYRSETQVLQDQASLDAAAAAVRQAEIALEQVNIRAPFAGVFDNREAEIGTYLSPGQPCGTLIELNPILIVGNVPETQAGRIRSGEPATATLVSGEVLSGQVRFVGREADPQTRTYRLEIIANNPQMATRSGLSADVRITTASGPAHLVPPSAMVLDAEGRQGVRHVGPGDLVVFTPVQVTEETPDGVWVRGLSGDVRLITVGQSYVDQGQKVRVALAR